MATNSVGTVNVPVAVLWSEPGAKREHDRLIMEAVTCPAAWADGMDTAMRLWLVGKADTQALLGERLVIIEQQADWLRVAAVSQTTSLNADGYPGWIPAGQVSFNHEYLENQLSLPQAVVAVPRARLRIHSPLGTQWLEVSYQTRLPLLREFDGYSAVRLPDGQTGFLQQTDIQRAADLAFGQKLIINQARQFLGLRYIWAGTSAYGFDCSGFTFRLYQSQGIHIPRDADDQAQAGVPAAKDRLQPGDLLFFATDAGQGQIHHVGMYSGNGKMIHAPNSRSAIKEDPITAGDYASEYWGARRYSSASPPMEITG